MKTLLMHRDRDFDLEQALPRHAQALVQDLELDTLLGAMAGDDTLVLDVARRALLSGLRNERDTVLYRQAILDDCLRNPRVIRDLYDLAGEGLQAKKKGFFGFAVRYPGGILYEAIEALRALLGVMRRVRAVADKHADRFASEGMKTLFAMLQAELDEEYLARVEVHLRRLKFPGGLLLSASLGEGNRGTSYVLRKPHEDVRSWWRRWLAEALGNAPPGFSFRIADRDDAGATVLSELRDRGIHLVANALAQSVDHVGSFFGTLRSELAFYVGCVKLSATLARIGVPTSCPVPDRTGTRALRARGLCDVCLALAMDRRVVGNTVDVSGKSLCIITGANQGGKSSFLRAIGLAQIMMQSGMFVAADSFTAEVCTGLFTHYKREEDASMKSGKFDEELLRMSDIVDFLSPDAVVLLNESFASTNEREGSQIAGQVARALVESGVRVFFVTHLHAFARRVFDDRRTDAIFLRAERLADGKRTYKLVEGEPLKTSYGHDLYNEVFGCGAQKRRAG